MKTVSYPNDDVRNITARPEGGYRVRMQYRKQPLSRDFEDLGDAQRWRDGLRHEIAEGSLVLATGATVADLGQSFLNTRSHLGAYGNDRQLWSSHIFDMSICALQADLVSRRDVRDWIRELEKKKADARGRGGAPKRLGYKTRLNCKVLLSQFFEWAIEEELTKDNPVAGIKVRKLPGEGIVTSDWYLEPKEQLALLDRMAKEADGPLEECDERPIVKVAMGTGMRRGEIWTLHLADVHLDAETPYLMVHWGGFKDGHLRAPKNGRTRRVDLFGMALDGMREWMSMLPRYAPTNPRGLVFPKRSGAMRHGSAGVPASFKRARKAVTRTRIWWHLLRHTCASSLVAGWWGPAWDLKEICDHLGHSSILVTERYAHLAPGARSAKAVRTTGLVRRSTGQSASGGNDDVLLSRPGDLNASNGAIFSGKTRLSDSHRSTLELALNSVAAGDPVALRTLSKIGCDILAADDAARLLERRTLAEAAS